MTYKTQDWAIDCAADFLRRRGCLIVDDRTGVISLVAWEEQTDTMIFIRVRQADALGPIRAVPRASREAFARECRKWKRVNKWRGAVRTDEIHVYGRAENGRPVVDHIENVRAR